jgi:hypothetical protein
MRPTTTGTARHERLLADLERHARADERIRAAWLEGSFATGTADAGSDLDLHLAVTDETFDSFCADARGWVEEVRESVGYLSIAFGPRRMFGFSLRDWMRLDLFVEPMSRVGEPARPVTPRMLFDRDGLEPKLRVDPTAAFDPAARITEIINTLLFGFTFPARLSARAEWGSLHLNALLVLYQMVVPAMIAQRHPEHAFRPQLHNERFLDPDQRAGVDALAVELARAFSERPPDADAVRAAHAHLQRVLFDELGAAAAAHGAEWSPATEAVLRTFLREELQIVVD